jgi:hypothetical protein
LLKPLRYGHAKWETGGLVVSVPMAKRWLGFFHVRTRTCPHTPIDTHAHALTDTHPPTHTHTPVPPASEAEGRAGNVRDIGVVWRGVDNAFIVDFVFRRAAAGAFAMQTRETSKRI